MNTRAFTNINSAGAFTTSVHLPPRHHPRRKSHFVGVGHNCGRDSEKKKSEWGFRFNTPQTNSDMAVKVTWQIKTRASSTLSKKTEQWDLTG